MIAFQLKQKIKMLLQNRLLPLVYGVYRRRPVEKGLVLFADAHHAKMPFSMQRMYEAVHQMEMNETVSAGASGDTMPPDCEEPADGIASAGSAGTAVPNDNTRYHIENFVTDFDTLSFIALARYLLRFMRRYAVAEYVFICDYFLPAASCRKRPETKVVQLWHSCGLTKKIAYDAGEDIPKGYSGDMFGNYTYLTMSAPICVPVHERALRLSREHIFATGISRTDFYFDTEWNERCRENFRRLHPEAAGKKVALWAPTFRGNAARPRLEGLEAVRQTADALKDDWYFVIKAHPHVDRHEMVSNSTIPTEELFPVADVLITDYSSVLFDYLLYQRPAILFAPDLEEYEEKRGFYIDYRSMPFPLAQTEAELKAALEQANNWYAEHAGEIDAFRETYVGACDGHATERILKLAGLT
ncbi:MAG: CDP-glycerol glycerophosphotransferase family protein [Lachnospiraceae bacterium]|nr:CDP-glycerol glycerophosphotransferase family protein [Lachnospiraceae bacterium]